MLSKGFGQFFYSFSELGSPQCCGQVGSGSGKIVPDPDADTNPDLTFAIRKSV
jgi:hypothetical protein